MTYLNDKAQPYVASLAEAVEAPIFLSLEARETAQMDAVFAAITAQWGRLDIVVHSIAFAPREALTRVSSTVRVTAFLPAMDGGYNTPRMSCARLIGVVNAGSSSLKFSLYEGEDLRLLGQINGIGIRPVAKAASARNGARPTRPRQIRFPRALATSSRRWCLALQRRSRWPPPQRNWPPRGPRRRAPCQAGTRDAGPAGGIGGFGSAGAPA